MTESLKFVSTWAAVSGVRLHLRVVVCMLPCGCVLSRMFASHPSHPSSCAGRRLDGRAARHAFLREHGLLSMRKVQGLDRRRSGPERDTTARLRVFARYR